MTAIRNITAAALAIGLFAGGCSSGDEARAARTGRDLGKITLAGSLQAFDACEQFLEDVKDQARAQVGAYGFDGYMVTPDGFGVAAGRPRLLASAEAATAGAASGAAAGDSAASAPPTPQPGRDFSETNVQEKGVDEPDVVKTDGKVIVAAVAGRLRVFEPGDTPKEIGSVELPSSASYGEQILLIGDRVLVFGQGAEGHAYRHMMAIPKPTTLVTAVSIGRPDEPRVLGSATVDGSFVNARLIDGTARVVLQSAQPQIDWVQPLPGELPEQWRAHEEAAQQRNRELLDASTAEDWLPKMTDSKGETKPLVTCERIHHPEQKSGIGLTSVLSVDRDGRFGDAVSVLGSAGTVYASTTGLYVATMATPPAAVTPVGDSVDTALHRFDISDPERAYYVGSGQVPGHLLNQFSMSEHDGRLRVATTNGFPGSGSESLVTVLEPQEGRLAQVGQVGGLGKDERIYSVRFIGDLGYVVTFRQTDPLYVIDLSDPTKPTVRGELKINGYSAYLHPISDTLLLGVGQDATDEGRRLGLQLSLFDVSDPAAPKRLHQATIAGAFTEAEHDHHAFLYWAPTKLTAVPFYDQGGSGLVGFSVDGGAGIRELGRVRPAQPADGRYVMHSPGRSFVVGSRLYVLSGAGLTTTTLDTLKETGSVSF